MFGLNESMFNAVKKQAAKLNEAYEKLTQDERKNDKFVATLITDKWMPVSTVISRDRFCWTAGFLKGRVGHNEKGESLYD